MSTSLRYSVVIVLAGLVAGGLTAVGQGYLPGDWNTLVNSGAVWLLVAFGVSAFAPSNVWAVVAGMGTLVLEVMAYFVAVWLMLGLDIPLMGTGFWLAVAVVAGPLFGMAGRWWRVGGQKQRVIALALMGSVFLAEGLIALLWGEQYKVASRWVEIAIGLLIPLGLGRTNKDRALGLAGLPVVTLLGLGVYQLINWATMLTFSA
jgi:hypothetical protein